MKKTAFALTLALAFAVAPLVAGQAYELDPGHSHVGFAVRHFGVSKVRGEFKKFDVKLTVDEENLAASQVEVTIDAASIFSDHEQRDNHLKSADFLDVETHPQIVFKSKQIEHLGGEEYRAVGDLTIRGVTKEVTLDLELGGPLKDPLGMMRVGIGGETEIDRQEYGVNWSRVMDNGGLFVGNDVEIEFGLEATRKIP